MNIERIIREQIYLYKRHHHVKIQRGSYSLSQNNKRLLGMLCILIGVLFMLSQCGKKDESQKVGAKTSYRISITVQSQSIEEWWYDRKYTML